MSTRKNQPQTAQLKNWKVKPETLKAVNIECAHLEITQYELAEKALEAFKSVAHRGEMLLGTSTNNNRSVTDNAYWHTLLEAILSSETEHAILTVKAILETLTASVALVEPMTSEETRTLVANWLQTHRIPEPSGRASPKRSVPKRER